MQDLVDSLGSISVGEFLRETNLYQKDLARLLQVSVSSVERWKAQGTPPRVGLLLASWLAHRRHDVRPRSLMADMTHFMKEIAHGERATIRGRSLSAYRYALIKANKREI